MIPYDACTVVDIFAVDCCHCDSSTNQSTGKSVNHALQSNGRRVAVVDMFAVDCCHCDGSTNQSAGKSGCQLSLP